MPHRHTDFCCGLGHDWRHPGEPRAGGAAGISQSHAAGIFQKTAALKHAKQGKA
jgi:hypothetical protein